MTNILIKLQPSTDGRFIFHPGQTLRGVVELILDHPKKVRGFYIIIIGEAKCHWSESSGSGKSRHTVSYDGHVMYLNSKTYFFGYKGAAEVEIPAGILKYDFACNLPPLLPETLAATKGSIEYRIEACLDIPWRFDKEIRVPITVIRNDNIYDNPELLRPMQLEDEKTFCCLCIDNGMCTMTVKIPQKAFILGESIPINIECVNKSSVKISRIAVKLKRHTNFTSSRPRIKTKVKSEVVLFATIEGVEKNTSKGLQFTMQIPSVLVPSNGQFCSVVTIEYVLQVKGYVGCCHSDFKIKLPVILARPYVALPTISNTVINNLPVQPTAPTLAVPDDDLPPSFEEAVGLVKLQDPNDNYPSTSNAPVGWSVTSQKSP